MYRRSVRGEENRVFHSIIESFAEHSGVPMVLNTSFNIGNEPIVATPLDAIRSFAGSPLDLLLIEDCVVSKRGGAA